MTFFQTILAVFATLDVLNWCILSRKVRRVASWPLKVAFHGFFVFQLGFVALIYRATHDAGASHLLHGLPTPCHSLALIWHILLAPVFLVASLLGLTGEGFLAFLRLFRRTPAGKPVPSLAEETGGISRRRFLGITAALTPVLFTGSLGAIASVQMSNFRVRRFTISLHDLPEALDGMTIAHLSDLHVGQFTSPEMLLEVVETTNRLKADLNLFTGDLINNDTYWLPRAMDTLRAIQPEVAICKGNHDLGLFTPMLKQNGFCLLVNEATTRTVRGVPVQLLGLDWDGPANWQNRGEERNMQASMEQILALRDPNAFPILLAHHPHAWDYCGDITLTLSGHTHGGQLMLNDEHGFGPAMFRYWSGLYTSPIGPGQPNKTLVVSNGVGNWFPLRANAPAEILHLTLRRG